MLGLIPDVIKNQALAKDAYDLLRGLQIENLTHPPEDYSTDPNARGEIEFRNVTFAYPSDPPVTALHKVSFRVGPGQHIALGTLHFIYFSSQMCHCIVPETNEVWYK